MQKYIFIYLIPFHSIWFLGCGASASILLFASNLCARWQQTGKKKNYLKCLIGRSLKLFQWLTRCKIAETKRRRSAREWRQCYRGSIAHSFFLFSTLLFLFSLWRWYVCGAHVHLEHTYCFVMRSVIYGFGLIRVIENGRRVCISAAWWPLSVHCMYRAKFIGFTDMRPYGITHSVVYHDISDLLAFSEQP